MLKLNVFHVQNKPFMGKSAAVGSFICFVLTVAFSSLKKHIPDLIIIDERFVSPSCQHSHASYKCTGISSQIQHDFQKRRETFDLQLLSWEPCTFSKWSQSLLSPNHNILLASPGLRILKCLMSLYIRLKVSHISPHPFQIQLIRTACFGKYISK